MLPFVLIEFCTFNKLNTWAKKQYLCHLMGMKLLVDKGRDCWSVQQVQSISEFTENSQITA